MENDRQKKGLGRGLSALMGDIDALPQALSAGVNARPGDILPIGKLRANPNQPRRDFDASALRELAESIKARGIIQPIVVRSRDGHYEIVAGERRWRAAQQANLLEVPVVIRNFSDDEVLEVAIIENIQRENLNAVEEALGFRQLMDRFGHTQEKLAEALAKSRSYIANTLRLLNLPTSVQVLIREGKLSAGHARALIGVPDPEGLAQEVINNALSVRETENLVKKKKNRAVSSGGEVKPSQKNADIRALEQDLSAGLSMAVSIKHQSADGCGHIKLQYENMEELDLLCQLLSRK